MGGRSFQALFEMKPFLTPTHFISFFVLLFNDTEKQIQSLKRSALWSRTSAALRRPSMLCYLLYSSDQMNFFSELRPREVTLVAACTLISLREQMFLSRGLRPQQVWVRGGSTGSQSTRRGGGLRVAGMLNS